MYTPFAQYVAWWPQLLAWLTAIGWVIVALMAIGLIALLVHDWRRDKERVR
jgi:hypothetical protein